MDSMQLIAHRMFRRLREATEQGLIPGNYTDSPDVLLARLIEKTKELERQLAETTAQANAKATEAFMEERLKKLDEGVKANLAAPAQSFKF